MLRRVLIGLLVLIVGVFGYVGYNSYSAKRTSEEIYSGGQIVRASGTNSAGEMQVQPSSSGGSELTANGASSAHGVAPPAADSISPEPPDGEKFGKGGSRYQLYRQGDITWRLNTDTGETCIIFATDEEWHKPKVYQAGCRGRS